MLGSKNLAKHFHRFTNVSPERLERMEAAARELTTDKGRMEMRHLLYLTMLGFGVAAFSAFVSQKIPVIEMGGQTVVSTGGQTVG